MPENVAYTQFDDARSINKGKDLGHFLYQSADGKGVS